MLHQIIKKKGLDMNNLQEKSVDELKDICKQCQLQTSGKSKVCKWKVTWMLLYFIAWTKVIYWTKNARDIYFGVKLKEATKEAYADKGIIMGKENRTEEIKDLKLQIWRHDVTSFLIYRGLQAKGTENVAMVST